VAENWRPGQGLPIERLYAWVATEPDGGEGLCSVTTLALGTMPLIGADRERIESLRPHAEITRKLTGYPVRLVRFLRTDVMEELP